MHDDDDDTAPFLPTPERDPVVTVELELDLADLAGLSRLPALVRAAPSRPIRLIWHDDAAQTLEHQAISLCHDGASWQLDRLAPTASHSWPACGPSPTLARGADREALGDLVPAETVPMAALEGRSRAYRAGNVALSAVHGTVRGVVTDRPASRLVLTGPALQIPDVLAALSALRVRVPRATLAREALAAAKDAALPARHLGAPAVDGKASVSDGLAAILDHLLDTLLFWTDRFRAERLPEAVHQARVATRRLRSALSVYRAAAACPELAAAAAAVKQCATILGAPRDWDVFLSGTGARLAEAAGRDARIGPLLRAAGRRREATYSDLGEYLGGGEFRRLELLLGATAALRPWDRLDEPDPALRGATTPFAAGVLTKRLKRVRQRGRHIEELPVEALHELRKDCKRLRYATEFFGPAFAAKQVKPFGGRLSALQEALGALNDAAAAALLMGQLGRVGRGYAGGMVDGMAAAAIGPARTEIFRCWKRFKHAAPFWH